tara:strand:+ start:33 stop:320 length:288 start_codon:yes stop_codon:yes gene_type:complete
MSMPWMREAGGKCPSSPGEQNSLQPQMFGAQDLSIVNQQQMRHEHAAHATNTSGFDLGRSDSDLLEPWFAEIMRPALVMVRVSLHLRLLFLFLPS